MLFLIYVRVLKYLGALRYAKHRQRKRTSQLCEVMGSLQLILRLLSNHCWAAYLETCALGRYL